MGRPPKVTEELVKKLEDIIKMGGTVTQACKYTGISRELYYHHYNKNPEFSSIMDKAKEYLLIESKQLVHKAITKDRDLQTAKWYLDKKEHNQPVLQQFNIDSMGVNIQPLDD